MKAKIFAIILIVLMSFTIIASAEEVLFNSTFTQKGESGGKEFTPTDEGKTVLVELTVETGEELDIVISDSQYGEWSASEWDSDDIVFREYDTTEISQQVTLETDYVHTLWIYGANYNNPEITLKITEVEPGNADSGESSLPLISVVTAIALFTAIYQRKH